MLENYIATYLIDIAALVFLCFLIYSSNIMEQNRKGPFYTGAVLTVLIILSEAGTIITRDGSASLSILNIFCNVFGFSLSPLIPVILVSIFNKRFLIRYKWLMLPSALNMLAAALSPLLGIIFYIDADNNYQRGGFFFIFIAAYIINMIILLVGTIRKARGNHNPIKVKIIALSVFAIAGTSIQIIMPSVHSSWHSVTLSLLIYYFLMSEYDGSFDALTGLYNRAAYEKDVKKLGSRRPYAVAVVDVNNFKDVNDTNGHSFGDITLKKVAFVIMKSFESCSACYRVGGDEFQILSSETDPERLEARLKNMAEGLEEERRIDNRLPTLAYGYAICKNGKEIEFQEVLKKADEQMYLCKNAQRSAQKTTNSSDGNSPPSS